MSGELPHPDAHLYSEKVHELEARLHEGHAGGHEERGAPKVGTEALCESSCWLLAL